MTALTLDRVSRRYRDVVALDDLSLTVDPGEICALVGLNGSGKTTLMRLALGMSRPDSGRVRVLGAPVGHASWARVGHLIETPFAYPELTVAENVAASARLHGMRTVANAVARTLDSLGLGELARRRTGTLSLGNRQRVGIAAAVVHAPDLLVLDEPTNALDPAAVVRLRDLLADLAARGSAVVVSSHHLDEVARVATRTVAIHRGRLLGEVGGDVESDFFAMAYADDVRRGLADRGAA